MSSSGTTEITDTNIEDKQEKKEKGGGGGGGGGAREVLNYIHTYIYIVF